MKPEYAPKTLGQKLGYLTEECGEVLAAVGKTQRWGPFSVNPEPGASKETNRDWILRELEDLKGAIQLAEEALRELEPRPDDPCMKPYYEAGDPCPKCEKPMVEKAGHFHLREVGPMPGIVCEDCNALWTSKEFHEAVQRRVNSGNFS